MYEGATRVAVNGRPGEPGFADKLYAALRVEFGIEDDDSPEALDLRKVIDEQVNNRLVTAVESATKRFDNAATNRETLERIGISGDEWMDCWLALAEGLGIQSHSTNRLKRIGHDAFLLGFLCGLEYDEPGASDRSPSERVVMQRRRHGHHASRKTGR